VPTSSKADLYRKLPSVDELLHSPDLTAIISSEASPPSLTQPAPC